MKKKLNFKLFLYLQIFNCINSDETNNNSIINNVSIRQVESASHLNNQVSVIKCSNPAELSSKCAKRRCYSGQYDITALNVCGKAQKKENNHIQQLYGKEAQLNSEQKLYKAITEKGKYIDNYYIPRKKIDGSIKHIDESTSTARNKDESKNKYNSTNINNHYGIGDNDELLIHGIEKNTIESPFFIALECLFKSIFYYRINITKFFIIFHSKLGDKYNKHVRLCSKDTLIEEFIDLSLQFAKNAKDIVKCDLDDITDKIKSKKTKIYEAAHIQNLNNSKNKMLLIKSKEYRKIHEHNHEYYLSLNIVASNVKFLPLSDFLKHVFERTLKVSRYYYMLSHLLASLYDISMVINKNLEQFDNNNFDKTIFEVCDCSCSEQTKKNFIFHWAFCWISYFSKNCFFPKRYDVNVKKLALINQYPKEFFVQCIVLVHYNINIKNTYTETKYLDKKAKLILKQTITDLLFNNLKDKNISLFQQIIYNLYKAIQDIKNPDIYIKVTVYNIVMQQTHQNQIDMMNKLIPAITNLNKFIFDLTKESYRLAKLKIDRS